MNQQIQNQQDQHSRTERARYALNHRQFSITQTSGKNWNVQNGDKQPYLVSNEQEDWVCNCEDFIRNRHTGLRCKHIEAVRFLQNDGKLSVEETPELYSDSNSNVEEIVVALNQPLDMERVKRRKAPGGSVPYLEGYDIIDQANRLFKHQWSFILLSEPSIERWDRMLTTYDQASHSKVPLLVNGEPVFESVGLVHITGKVMVLMGNRQFSHADIGRCTFSGDTPEALDMAIAGCATDCLKRCFRQLGDQFGNSLYDKDVAKVAGTTQSFTQKLVDRVYRNGERVNGNISEQDAFDRFVKTHHGTVPSTRDALRQWLISTEQQNETISVSNLAMATN